MRAKQEEHFDFLSPCEVTSNQFVIPMNTPYKIEKISKRSKTICVSIVFKLIDGICYHYDLELPNLEDIRAAGWAV